MNETPSRLNQLDRQRADGFLTLRFHPELEPEYLADHANGIVPRRLALLGTGLILVAVTPLLDALFLHPPPGFARVSHWVQYGFMIPSLIVAITFTLVPALRRASDAMGVACAFVVCAGVIYQRHAGAGFGYPVPSELVAVVLTGTAVLAGLRTVYFTPMVVLVLALSAWSEIDAFGAGNHSDYVVLAQGMLGIIAVIGAGMEEYAERAAWLQRKMLEELTLRDPLTGLVNARGLRDVYRRIFATSMREHRPMLVIAVDIDHFKAYNDHYGHLAGDDCLRRVANILSRHGRRGNDVAARTGGEEFVLVWYDVAPDQAPRLLESLRQDVERLGILHAGIPHRPSVVTVSIGAASAVPGPRMVPESLLQIADEQLYLSKQRGRNCVSLHVNTEPTDPAAPAGRHAPLPS